MIFAGIILIVIGVLGVLWGLLGFITAMAGWSERLFWPDMVVGVIGCLMIAGGAVVLIGKIATSF